MPMNILSIHQRLLPMQPRSTADINHAAHILSELAAHRVLYNSYDVEYVAAAVLSVDQLTATTTEFLKTVDAHSCVRPVLDGLQTVCSDCRTDLDAVERSVQEAFRIMELQKQRRPSGDSDSILYQELLKCQPFSIRDRRVNLVNLGYPMTQYMFVAAIERLRVHVATLVNLLALICGNNAMVPQALKPMLVYP